MKVLFVHGMGRSPLSAWPLLRRLRQSGMETMTFAYIPAFECFDSIASRLTKRITSLANRGDYIVIGHSLGGVLLRAAINRLPKDITRPRHVFLLGSPVRASRIAKRFRHNILFRALTGDCGQLLSSGKRMKNIGALSAATTSIVGVCGFTYKHNPFGQEPNDGVVAVSECSAEWIYGQLKFPVVHTLLPSNKCIADTVINIVSNQ
jgi:pimeloyl-ACP methyl ester carboxylesterase